jgi:apyrase
MYHWTLVSYGYSMNDSNLRNFKIVQMINSTQIGWTLGYMINQTNYLDPEYRPPHLLTQGEFIGIIICFLVILVISIILFILTIIIHQRRKKSVFD